MGYFDDEKCRLEPIDNSFGPKLLPISPEQGVTHVSGTDRWNGAAIAMFVRTNAIGEPAPRPAPALGATRKDAGREGMGSIVVAVTHRRQSAQLLRRRTLKLLQKKEHMPKYLVTGEYIGDGISGLLKEGGTARRAAVKALVKSVGRKAGCPVLRHERN